MRRLFLTTTAIVMLGCGTSLAQVTGSTSTMSTVPSATTSDTTMLAPTMSGAATSEAPPSSTQAPTYSGLTVSMPPPGAPGSALGAIHLNLAAPLSMGGIGTISTCQAVSGGGAANIPVDATDATIAATPGFNASGVAAICQPPAPPATAGLISAPIYSNSVAPLSTSEAGGTLGLSPSITVPIPTAPTQCTNNAAATPPIGSVFTSSSVATTVPSGC